MNIRNEKHRPLDLHDGTKVCSTTPPEPPAGLPISRRKVLKYAGSGIGAGLFLAALGEVPAGALSRETRKEDGGGVSEHHSGKTAISLMIDDGGPIDAMYYMHPGYPGPLLPPVEFFRRVADTFDRFGLQGKMTCLPMPSCLGRIDQSVKRVPQQDLQSFLKIVRTRIAPRFDITPEFLTHLCAYDMKAANRPFIQGGSYRHVFEDVWISGAPLTEVVEYFNLAFTILKNVGVNSTGITSPWEAGSDVEKKYAQALSEAQWKTFGRNVTWYFLHGGTDWKTNLRCSVTYESPAHDRAVVSVPANFPDPFWTLNMPLNHRKQFISDNLDRILSPDGRTGRIRQLIELGYPVTLLTHWQSLFTQGDELGLQGLNALMERIQKVFGNQLEWISCSERAQRYLAAAKVKA